jgi:8-hydroxy-5-deazaflavin:NADPH oxidoreductase
MMTMNVTILGNGKMAKAIGLRLVAAGNRVTILGRDKDKASSLAMELSVVSKKGGTVKSGAIGDPVNDELVISTINYPAVKEVLSKNANQFANKVVVDISNSLTPSFDDVGTPPGTSAAEEIAMAAPKGVRLLKGFNTNFAGVLAQGSAGDQAVDVFIAGDDAPAKTLLTSLINEAGMRAIDAGPLKRARQLEGMAMLLITLQGRMDKPWMNSYKIVA